jgi:hypothetical protein
LANIFEGARRISRLGHGLIGLATLGYLGLSSPSITMTFETLGPDRSFTWTPIQCDYMRDAERSTWHTFPDGSHVNVSLCFRASRFSDGRYLIPFKVDDGRYWGDEQYSSSVSAYTESRDLDLSGDALRGAEEAYSHLWWKEKFDGAFWGVVTALVVAAGLASITWIVGWIVRGFMGIERGHDKRTSAP